jgi:hypothetical protein
MKYLNSNFIKSFIVIYFLTLIVSTILVLILISVITSFPAFDLKIIYETSMQMIFYVAPIAIFIALAKSKGLK